MSKVFYYIFLPIGNSSGARAERVSKFELKLAKYYFRPFFDDFLGSKNTLGKHCVHWRSWERHFHFSQGCHGQTRI